MSKEYKHQRLGLSECWSTNSETFLSAISTACLRSQCSGSATTQIFFLSEQISKLPFPVGLLSCSQKSGGTTGWNSITSFFCIYRSFQPKRLPLALAMQLKMKSSLISSTSSKVLNRRCTNLAPLKTASNLNSSRYILESIRTVEYLTPFSFFLFSNRRSASTKVSQMQSVTTSLSSSILLTKSQALMFLTPWNLLTLSDSLKKSNEILENSSCLSASPDQSCSLGIHILGMANDFSFLSFGFSSQIFSEQMVTFLPAFMSSIAVNNASIPPPNTAQPSTFATQNFKGSCLLEMFDDPYARMTASKPYPQLWKIFLPLRCSNSSLTPPFLQCAVKMRAFVKFSLEMSGSLIRFSSVCVIMMKQYYKQSCTKMQKSSVSSLLGQVTLPGLAQLVVMGHELVVVVIDALFTQALQLQSRALLFRLDAEGAAFLRFGVCGESVAEVLFFIALVDHLREDYTVDEFLVLIGDLEELLLADCIFFAGFLHQSLDVLPCALQLAE